MGNLRKLHFLLCEIGKENNFQLKENSILSQASNDLRRHSMHN